MRLAIVTNIPTHYREPVYERIDGILRSRGGLLHVVYAAMRDPGQRWPQQARTTTYEATFLRASVWRTRRGRAVLADPRVVSALEQVRPSVVVAGGYAPWVYFVAAWARLHRVPLLLWSAETLATARLRGFRRLRRRPLVRTAARFLAYGPPAHDYLVALGIASERITVVGNGIDVARFRKRAEARRKERDAIRHSLGFEGPTVLSVGGKGLDVAAPAVVRAGARLAVAGPSSDDPRALNLGMVDPSEMARLYVASDALVHTPVADYWPHAINEALAAGIPVVASPDTGIAAEILTGPGCAVVPREVEAVARGLAAALQQSHVASAAVREAVRAPLVPWSAEPMASRFVAACEAVAR